MLAGGGGGGGLEDINFSPFLAPVSLVFPRCHARSAGEQAAPAAVPSHRAPRTPSPPRILFSPAPPRSRSVSPATVPFQTSPPARWRWLIFSPHVWARRPGLLTDQQLTDTSTPRPLLPKSRHLRPKPSLANKSPEARAAVISEIAP